ncbi:putative transmembrane protein [Candidatus Sulfopaludibacter sp. SbA3]|nr:putative transmembrane protein [Candidatus Sulfopaludibacter sp. SbA3]
MVPALILIAIGALFFLNNLHILPVRDLLHYWPAILVAVGIMLLVDSKDSSGQVAGGVFAGVGAFLLARNLWFPEIAWHEMWPLLLIGLGLLMLWDRTHWYAGVLQSGYRKRRRMLFGLHFQPKESTVFGSSTRSYYGQEFDGGRYETVFGGIEIDLRGSHMAGDEAVLKIDAVMGGAEIKVPDTWLVIIKATAVFGAVINSTKAPDPVLVPNPKRLIVKGAAVFGGVELKN